jgi:HAD superfamily hydrolase (TIGR01509 family)
MPLGAVVFDFDGVLANSEPLHYEAYRSVLADERVPLDASDYYARYLGYDDVGAFQAIARDRGRVWSEAEISALVARKARRMEDLEREISVLFPGAADAVRLTAAAVPIAIASGALRAEIVRVLDREQLTGCFTAIVAAGETPVSKPAPDPYQLAVELLNRGRDVPLPAGDCVAIEDSLWGLESARRAGLRTVAVAQTYDAAALSGADLVLGSIGDLRLELLENLCRP